MKGRRVSMAETVDGTATILEGACDELPEDRLFMIGSLAEVRDG